MPPSLRPAADDGLYWALSQDKRGAPIAGTVNRDFNFPGRGMDSVPDQFLVGTAQRTNEGLASTLMGVARVEEEHVLTPYLSGEGGALMRAALNPREVDTDELRAMLGRGNWKLTYVSHDACDREQDENRRVNLALHQLGEPNGGPQSLHAWAMGRPARAGFSATGWVSTLDSRAANGNKNRASAATLTLDHAFATTFEGDLSSEQMRVRIDHSGRVVLD